MCSDAVWSTDIPRGYNNGHFNLMQVCAVAKTRNLVVVFSSVAFFPKAVAETLGILQLQEKSDFGKNWFGWKPAIRY